LTIAVERTSHGYDWPVLGLRRFSVRKTVAFSCALPTNSTPSGAGNRARWAAITSSFRWPFSNVISGTWCSATNASIAAMKAWLIGAISTEEANGCPRCLRKNVATPPSYCSAGT